MDPRCTNHSRRLPLLMRLAALGLPLLALGPCTTQMTEAVIGGLFDGLTIVAVEAAEDQLGLDQTTGGPGTNSTP